MIETFFQHVCLLFPLKHNPYCVSDREDVSEGQHSTKLNELQQEPLVHVYIGTCLIFLEEQLL